MIEYNPTFSALTNVANLVSGLTETEQFGVRSVRRFIAHELNLPFSGDKGLNIRGIDWETVKPAVEVFADTVAAYAVTKDGLAHESGLKQLDRHVRNAVQSIGGFSVRVGIDRNLNVTKAYQGDSAINKRASRVSGNNTYSSLVGVKPKQAKTDILDPITRVEDTRNATPTPVELEHSHKVQDSIDRYGLKARETALETEPQGSLVPVEHIERAATRMLDDRAVWTSNREARALRKLLRIQSRLIKKENKKLQRELDDLKRVNLQLIRVVGVNKTL